MDADPVLHPSDQTLSSYGLGKLDDRSAEAVNKHLEGCDDCRSRVAAISADSFLVRVRDAQATGKPASGQSQTGGHQGNKGSNAPAPPPADTLPPGLADHPDYQIQRELGRGGMGVVYLAHNALMGRDEVLKVMGRQIIERPGVLDRFLREIRAVAKLRHVNIVTAYSAMRLGESLVFAMEYVEGLDLSKLVKAKGPLPVAHACLFAHQAALGLQHAHEKGMVHRDIKPHNLMLTHDGDKRIVKILDFGLAKATREQKVDGSLTQEGQALGTPDYIAPEQILDAQSADIRADIYSLGATLYYLLTGRPPFQANSLYDIYQAHISRDADPLNLVRPEVPSELAALVAKMMAKDPARRFQTPGEVAQALAPFFKRGNVAFKGPGADVSLAGQTTAGGPLTGGAVSAPTRPATEVEGPVVRPKQAAESTVPETRWESLIEFRETESATAMAPAFAPTRRPPWMWPSVAALALMLGLFAAWQGGVFKVKTPDGVIVLENVPKDAEILVDGHKITFTWPGVRIPVEIRAVPGQHKIEVKKEEFKTFGEMVTVKADDSEEVTVRLEPLVVDRSERKEADATTSTGRQDGLPDTVTRNNTYTTADSAQRSLTAEVSDFVPLFNGRDLTGWKRLPSQPGNWRVENGVLVGSGPEVSHLFTDRGDFKDFHLRVEARINGGGNSGVYFRAPFGAVSPVNNPMWPLGYEAQINSTHQDRNKTGSLYGGPAPGSLFGGTSLTLVRVETSEHFPGSWFTLELIADGNRLVIMVNGKITAHHFDEMQRYSKGHIVLQQHNPETVAEFRKIEIRELNGAHRPTTPDPVSPPKEITNTLGMKLVLIPAGEFQMGSPDWDRDAKADEKPQHRVRITRPFYLGVCEVKQEEYEKLTGRNPSSFSATGGEKDAVAGRDTRRHPVEGVSWNEAIEFCNKLSEREGLKPYYQSGAEAPSGGEGYRLPMEAEWEYACRAGSKTRYPFGGDVAGLGEYAWYVDNSGGRTHPVGQRRPNAWGLYDMHGNVWEWCGDWYGEDYYGQSPGVDPFGPSQAARRVYRGGCCYNHPRNCRSANRDRYSPGSRYRDLGFRVARVPSGR